MERLIQVLNTFLDSAILFLPKLVGAVILLAIGWVVGIIVGKVTREILIRLKVDQYVTRGKKAIFKLSDIFAVIFSWAIYLTFIQAAVEVLGIPALVTVFGGILAFIPGLVGAIIVVIAGYAIAEYVRQQIEASKIEYSGIIAKVVFFLTVYIAVAMALPLVNIDPFLINAILLVIIGSAGLGFAIALGLGLKDIIAVYAKRYLRKLS
jgi:hypothetical protein